MEELRNDLEKAVYQAILPVEDPELFISIMELGLIYDIKVNENNEANVTRYLRLKSYSFCITP